MTVLGEHRERWEAPLGFWREPEYEAQWRQGVGRILDGVGTSCLVTVMTEPGAGQLAQFWTLYRFGEEVAVHEQLWPESEFGPLYPDALYGALRPYEAAFETESGDREAVSEWRLPLSDFGDWLRG